MPHKIERIFDVGVYGKVLLAIFGARCHVHERRNLGPVDDQVFENDGSVTPLESICLYRVFL